MSIILYCNITCYRTSSDDINYNNISLTNYGSYFIRNRQQHTNNDYITLSGKEIPITT